MQRRAEALDWRDKAVWAVGDSSSVDDLVAARRHLFDGTVSWPALVLRNEALRSNIETVTAYTDRHGMLFAPHGKTSMAPELFRRQLDAGAWGITVATPHQAMVALRTGVPRVLIAHEVLDLAALRRLLEWRDSNVLSTQNPRDPQNQQHAELYCFVDSVEGLEVAAAAGASSPSKHPFPVLIDVGFPGGRTGVRTIEQALALAAKIRETSGVVLAGVACYEGGLPDHEAARAFIRVLKDTVQALLNAAAFGADRYGTRPIVSAGGSHYFDVVASELTGDDRPHSGSSLGWAADRGLRVVLRSGASVTHDDDTYAHSNPFLRVPDEGRLDPALELWAQVVSAPEPGLALVGMGKRDAPFDAGMPVPKFLRKRGSEELAGIGEIVRVTGLDDQHGYLQVPEDLDIRPGDLVCFGISHPCTAFDKWRVVPIVDEQYQIVDAVRTYF